MPAAAATRAIDAAARRPPSTGGSGPWSSPTRVPITHRTYRAGSQAIRAGRPHQHGTCGPPIGLSQSAVWSARAPRCEGGQTGVCSARDTSRRASTAAVGQGPHLAEEGRPASVRHGRSPHPSRPGKTRPPWGRGPTLRRRADRRLFGTGEARAEVGPGYNAWRCGDSNPGPLKFQRRHLRAQPTASLSGLGTLSASFPRPYPELFFPLRSRTPVGASCVATPCPGEAGTHREDGLLN